MNLEKILENSDFFSGISAESRRKVAQCASVLRIKKHRILFNEGDEGEGFYLLLDGAVRAFKTNPDGGEITLKLLKPGEIFAETILFEDNRYPAGAETASDSRLLYFKRDNFITLFENQDFRCEFIAMLMRKQRFLVGRILYLTRFDVEERFYMFLRERFGIRSEFRLELSKKDIASVIDAAPETFSRMIGRLKQRGVIRWVGDKLVFPGGFPELPDDD